MINASYVESMAQYNQWQNKSIFGAADGLSDAERRKDRGAVFQSIHQTLCHLLWGDQIWMSRFTDLPSPSVPSVSQSLTMIEDWNLLKEEREKLDSTMLSWARALKEADLDGNLSWYSGSQKRDVTALRSLLVVHMFNHQTHHRGQVHAMITAAGGSPDDTDLFILQSRKQKTT